MTNYLSAHSLRLSLLTQIDKICDQYESGWSEAQARDLASYLDRLGGSATPESRHELLCQLIAMDLEYHWRRHEASNRQAPDVPSPLQDYFLRFPELNCLRPLRCLELIQMEYRVRQRWGDRPDIEAYVREFPRFGRQLKPMLHMALADLSPTRVNVYQERQLKYSACLKSPLEIGRQKPGEPEPYCRFRAGDKDRLIVASASEKKVSRIHLSVELSSPKRLRVVNQSTKSSAMIDPGGRLGFGQAACFELPVVVSVADRVVRLEEY